ncbi:MAG: F0F1 ATP synthase subunit A [Propionibacteriaceae bacterium]|jgi:F-type H+-transporting ATPase subunit a|nr:F0F1 ATP synthase subunit A [Propionibacteriaceae bacterium]
MWPGVLPDWITGFTVQAILVAIFCIGIWLWFANKQTVVPSKKQFLGELGYNLIRNTIARDVLAENFRPYLPYLLALASFVIVNNLCGEFFLFMFPTTAKIGYVYGLALLSWILYNSVGIRKYGFFGYLKHSTMPAGVPGPLYILIIPLEFLSNIIVRPVTLALRLFGNMFAGHLVVLVVVLGGTLLIENGMKSNLGLVAAGVGSFLFSFAIFALELLVACIQAYIFTILTAQYVSSSLAEEH